MAIILILINLKVFIYKDFYALNYNKLLEN